MLLCSGFFYHHKLLDAQRDAEIIVMTRSGNRLKTDFSYVSWFGIIGIGGGCDLNDYLKDGYPPLKSVFEHFVFLQSGLFPASCAPLPFIEADCWQGVQCNPTAKYMFS
jgi:hypothetical protein